jgi:hypothetical protein
VETALANRNKVHEEIAIRINSGDAGYYSV